MPFLIPCLLLFAAISFGLGISLPLVKFEKLYFFEESPSLIGLFQGLWTEGNIAIALALFVFSLLFPVIKLGLTFLEAFGTAQSPAQSELKKWAAVLAKWSMMDVLLVALVIFATKTTGLATAVTQPGVWFYAASAVCGAAAAGLINRQFLKRGQNQAAQDL